MNKNLCPASHQNSQDSDSADQLASPQLLWKAIALSCKKVGIPAKRFKRRFFELELFDQHILYRLWTDEFIDRYFRLEYPLGLNRQSLDNLFTAIEQDSAEMVLLLRSIRAKARAGLQQGEGDILV